MPGSAPGTGITLANSKSSFPAFLKLIFQWGDSVAERSPKEMQNKFQVNPRIWTLKENEILTNLRVSMGESFDYLREVFPIITGNLEATKEKTWINLTTSNYNILEAKSTINKLKRQTWGNICDTNEKRRTDFPNIQIILTNPWTTHIKKLQKKYK